MKGKKMTQSLYSVYGTPIHLLLDDEFAKNYNRALDAFYEAQKFHLEMHGTPWTGLEPLNISWTPEEQKAYNSFADLMNRMIEMNGGGLEIGEEAMTSDRLVKL